MLLIICLLVGNLNTPAKYWSSYSQHPHWMESLKSLQERRTNTDVCVSNVGETTKETKVKEIHA